MIKKTKSIQLASLVIFLIAPQFLGIGIYNVIKSTSIDGYLSVIMGFIMGIGVLLLIFYISKIDDTMGIFDLNKKMFGQIIGWVINALLALVALMIVITSMYNIINFIVSQFLSETPLIIIGLLLGVVTIYAVLKDFEVISRISIIFIIINMFLFLLAVSGLFNEIDISNIKPYLEYGLTRPFMGSLRILAINVLPLFLILMFPRKYLIDKEKYNKYLVIYYIVAFILLMVFIGFTTLILGKDLISIYQFPEYIVLKKVKLLGFLDRIENIVSIQWMLGGYMSLVINTLFVRKFINNKKKNSIVTTSIVAIALFLALYLFQNSTFFNYFCYNYYPYILGILLPIFIVITIRGYFYKKRRN